MTRTSDCMSDLSFELMTATFNVIDLIYPHVEKRARQFGIPEGITLVDYGCGPGRYTVHFSRLVGPAGKVYAVDLHELAIQTVKQKMDTRPRLSFIPCQSS